MDVALGEALERSVLEVEASFGEQKAGWRERGLAIGEKDSVSPEITDEVARCSGEEKQEALRRRVRFRASSGKYVLDREILLERGKVNSCTHSSRFSLSRWCGLAPTA